MIKSLFVLLYLVLVLASPSLAGDADPYSFSTAENHLTFLGGYGQTHRGMGDTMTRVQQLDAIVQFGHFLTEELGWSWLKGRHAILFELPLSFTIHPDDAVMVGINVLGCWNFTYHKQIVPYIVGGGGIVYTNLDVIELGSELNGNYQGGFGVRYRMSEDTSIDFNYRLHHISNAGTAEPNDPLNSSKFLFGITRLM